MDYAYSTRPLTDEEHHLVRLWTEHSVYTAGLDLLFRRLEEPKLTPAEFDVLHPVERRAYMIGLLLSVLPEYRRHVGLRDLDRLDPTKERIH